MVKENKPQTTFEWRITRYKHADLYTLMDWSNVKKHADLPPEYTNYFGARFWDAGSGNIVLSGCTTDVKRHGDRLKRGDVMEKAEYDALVSHLQVASKRLQSVNQVIRTSSECITIEVK